MTARDDIAQVLRGAGLTDEPYRYDSSIHSRGCEHPDRYGPCDCFAELVDDLARLLDEARAEGWDEGWGEIRECCGSCLASACLFRPGFDPNPYRKDTP